MTISKTNGAVNGKNGEFICHSCKTVNTIQDRHTFSQEVTCSACGRNFDLQQWDWVLTSDEYLRRWCGIGATGKNFDDYHTFDVSVPCWVDNKPLLWEAMGVRI